jgi:hypothetical protein
MDVVAESSFCKWYCFNDKQIDFVLCMLQFLSFKKHVNSCNAENGGYWEIAPLIRRYIQVVWKFKYK